MKHLLFIGILFATILNACGEEKHYIEYSLIQEGSAWKGAEYHESYDGTWYEMASDDFWFYAVDGKVTETNIPKKNIKKAEKGLFKIDPSFLKVTKKHDGKHWFENKYKNKVSYKYSLRTYEGSYKLSKEEYFKFYEAKKQNKVITIEVYDDIIANIIYP